MKRERSKGAAARLSLQVGQPFNPFGLFNGIFIPEQLMRAKGISMGAKVTYGRLEVDPIVWTKNRQSLDGVAG